MTMILLSPRPPRGEPEGGTHYSLPTAHYSLLTSLPPSSTGGAGGGHSLLAAHYSLLTTYFSPPVLHGGSRRGALATSYLPQTLATPR